MSETPDLTPQRVEVIWVDETRHSRPVEPTTDLIHVGDLFAYPDGPMPEATFMCLDEHEEPDGTHVVGICLEQHYGMITMLRAVAGQPIVVFPRDDAP